MSEEGLLIGGWKEVSLVDVLEHVSFTVWLAYCNLKCPWCSNADLAKGLNAKFVKIEELVERVKEARGFVDVFHVTGGEPLLQHRALRKLFAKIRDEVGLPLSLDTNGTLPAALRRFVPLLYHLAIDVKAPLNNPRIYASATGISLGLAKAFSERVAESLRISLEVPFLELRTTLVPGLLNCDDVIEIAKSVKELAEAAKGRVVYVVQQFIPYEGVKGEFARRPATPSEEVKECAKRAAAATGLEVYYRTLEEGAKKLRFEL